MARTLPGSKGADLPKPLVAVIGDSEDMLGAIESCKDRLEFVHLDAIPDEPNFWSVRQIGGVVIRGLNWFVRFREIEPSEEVGVVVAGHAGLRIVLFRIVSEASFWFGITTMSWSEVRTQV